jgi:hypothetical protein
MSFTDDFTGTNGQELQNRDGWSLLGSNLSGRCTIYDNGLGVTNAGGTYGLTLYEAAYGESSASRYLEFTLAAGWTVTGRLRISIATVDVNNCIGIRILNTGSAGLGLFRRVAGTFTDSAITTQAATGDTYRLEVDDNDTIRLYRNGTQQGSSVAWSEYFTAIGSHGNKITIGCAPEDAASTKQLESFSAGVLSAATELVPDVSPLYYGQTLLGSKTNIQYKITSGHSTLDGEIITSGTGGTTDASGNFVLPAAITTGAATDPVTLHLYFEEGSDPAVDRSLIVKTTLVEA